MASSYSDIKRYRLNPGFLLQVARQAINSLGWNIQQEYENVIVAMIPMVNGFSGARLTVRIQPGYIDLNCESDSSVGFRFSRENQQRVSQFIETLDNHIASTPPDLIQTHRELFGHL